MSGVERARLLLNGAVDHDRLFGLYRVAAGGFGGGEDEAEFEEVFGDAGDAEAQ